ncbi:hypothetical protein ACWTWI_01775 [Staphylococcus hominis]
MQQVLLLECMYGKTTKNIMDEIFGKGAFEQILHSSGYIYGTTMNLNTLINKIEINEKKIKKNHTIMKNLDNKIDRSSENISNILEDL